MIHDKRTFCVGSVDSAEALAEKLTNHTWTLCTGFRFGGYLFLNDSFSEDGAAEFAVVKELPDGGHAQTESITFGWMKYPEALAAINQIVAGTMDTLNKPIPALRLEPVQGHRCNRCA